MTHNAKSFASPFILLACLLSFKTSNHQKGPSDYFLTRRCAQTGGGGLDRVLLISWPCYVLQSSALQVNTLNRYKVQYQHRHGGYTQKAEKEGFSNGRVTSETSGSSRNTDLPYSFSPRSFLLMASKEFRPLPPLFATTCIVVQVYAWEKKYILYL